MRVGGNDPYGRAGREVRLDTGFLRPGDDLILGASARFNALLGTVPRWRTADWCRVLLAGVPRRWVDRLADLAEQHGVTECLPTQVNRLSGGQRQRIALIRALLPGPRLLLADEPTTGLDPVTSAQAVRALHGTGATVVAATHDPAVAATFGRVVALRAGRLVYDGPPLDPADTVRIYRRGTVP